MSGHTRVAPYPKNPFHPNLRHCAKLYTICNKPETNVEASGIGIGSYLKLWDDSGSFSDLLFFGVRVMGRGRAISKNLQLSNHSPKLTKSIPTQKSWVPRGQPWRFRSFTISQKSSTKRWGRIASRVSSTQTWWLTRQDLFFLMGDLWDHRTFHSVFAPSTVGWLGLFSQGSTLGWLGLFWRTGWTCTFNF